MHLAAATAISRDLLPAMRELEASLRSKSAEFWPVVKTGRTHLQDATPIRLGQVFLGYAGQLELGRLRVQGALDELCVLALGGCAAPAPALNVGSHFSSIVPRWAPASASTRNFHAG